MDTNRRNRVALGVLALATLALGVWTRPGVGAPVPETARHFAAPHAGPVHFEGRLDRGAVLRGDDGVVRMQLTMRAEPAPQSDAHRVPTDVLVVLDRSGSMNGAKWDDARAAVRELMARLGADDRFALVSYANQARLDAPFAAASGDARERWERTLGSIRPRGATNLAGGIDLALAQVDARRDPRGRAARVILISDGLANRGDSSLAGLTARAARAAQGEYTLSAVGVGLDFDEQVMTAIADAGTGNYTWLEDGQDLSRVFAAEFESARATLARALELRIHPGPRVRVVEAGGYPLERADGAVRIRPGSLAAGQRRSLWVTLAVDGDALGRHELGRFSLSYRDGDERRELQLAGRPAVARVEDRREFVTRIDRPSFEAGLGSEAYGDLQQEVSGYVRSGRLEEADRAVDAFVDRYESLNAELRSPAVAEEIDRARKLKEDAKGAASSPESRNVFGKSRGYEALQLRRHAPEAAPEKGGSR